MNKISFWGNTRIISMMLMVLILSLNGVDAAYEEATPAKGELKEGQLDKKGVYWPFEEGQINLRIDNNRFRLYFLDLENIVQELAYTKAVVRSENLIKKNLKKQIISLSPDSSGEFLTSPRVLRPPHRLKVKVLLLNDEDKSGRKIFGFKTLR